MQSMVAAGAGFLLAVLWFDLMSDVQTLGRGDDDVPDAVLASVAGYDRRTDVPKVTTTRRQMSESSAVLSP